MSDGQVVVPMTINNTCVGVNLWLCDGVGGCVMVWVAV